MTKFREMINGTHFLSTDGFACIKIKEFTAKNGNTYNALRYNSGHDCLKFEYISPFAVIKMLGIVNEN